MKVRIKMSTQAWEQFLAAVEAASQEDSFWAPWRDRNHGFWTRCGNGVRFVRPGVVVFFGSRAAWAHGDFWAERVGTTRQGKPVCRIWGFMGIVEDVESSTPFGIEGRDDPWERGDVLVARCRELEALSAPPVHPWEAEAAWAPRWAA